MREQIQARLEVLKKELETGQAQPQQVEMQRTYLHETVLRISEAVQILGSGAIPLYSVLR
jgi:hypothetical protein